MGVPVRMANRNKWLGQPASAQGVAPAAAGRLVAAGGVTFIHRAELQTGVAMGAGVGCACVALLKDTAWSAGQWVNGTTTFTDDTTDAQDADTNDFALETTTATDGFIVGAQVPFGALSIDVTTAGVGATAHVIEYWNGSAWTAIAATGMLIDIPGRAGVIATGEQVILFIPPTDWVVGGSGTGVPATLYNIRIRATTGTISQAALARRIYVGFIVASIAGLALELAHERAFREPVMLASDQYAAIGSVFGVLDEGNSLTMEITDRIP